MSSARIVYYSNTTVTAPTLRTTTPLLAGATFDTGIITVDGNGYITGTVFADKVGTLFIEQSYDQTNWDVSTSYVVVANDGKGYRELVVADYARVRYTNGSTNQGAFRLTVNLK